MPAPPAFTDQQLDALMRAARPAARRRSRRVLAVARAFEIGDGDVYRVLAEAPNRHHMIRR